MHAFAAHTYAFASYLPPLLLDALLNIPYFLASVRNALLPVPPRVVVPPRAAAAAQPPPPQPPVRPAEKQKQDAASSGTDSEHEHEHEHSETGSEADVESNSGVGESWVSLKSRSTDAA